MDNLAAALAEYTETDRAEKPLGKSIEAAIVETRKLIARLDELCMGYDWRSKAPLVGWLKAAVGLAAYLRAPTTAGNQTSPTLGDQFRTLSGHLTRAWSLCAGDETLGELRQTVTFYEQVRVVMGKFDAQQRQAEGKPIPEEIKRLLARLVDASTAGGEIVDIYEAAGLGKPSLSDLTPEFEIRAKKSENPHLAIEALRALLAEEMGGAAKNNLVRQRAFSDRVSELMRKYTNQQLTSAEVIAELIAMAKEVAAEGDRGTPSSRRRFRMTSWPSTTL